MALVRIIAFTEALPRRSRADIEELRRTLVKVGHSVELQSSTTDPRGGGRAAVVVMVAAAQTLRSAKTVSSYASAAESGSSTLLVGIGDIDFEFDQQDFIKGSVERVRWTTLSALSGHILKLIDRAEEGQLVEPPAPMPTIYDWNAAPVASVSFGIDTHVSECVDYLRNESARVLAICGMGGIGKSTFAVALGRELGSQFEQVVWRPISPAASISDLCEYIDALVNVPPHQSRMASSGERLVHLIKTCRVLIILDSFDLALSDTAENRAVHGETEDFDWLLQALIDSSDALGRVIITSRVIPRPLVAIEGVANSSYVYMVPALPIGEIAKLLSHQSLQFSEAELTRLNAAYQGNPLALKLAGSYVINVLGGDLRTFLDGNAFLFSDIGKLVAEHVGNLAPFDQTVLTWLSLLIEPVQAPILRDRIRSGVNLTQLMSALENLRRRILVQSSSSGFAVHELVRRYMVDQLIESIVDEVVEAAELNVLDRYPLISGLQAGSIRESQRRAIVVPLADQLLEQVGEQRLIERLQTVVNASRDRVGHLGYAGSNLLVLLDAAGISGSVSVGGMPVVEARLDDLRLSGSDLGGAEFVNCRFSDTFGAVCSISVSRDGKMVAAGTFDGRLRVWDVRDWSVIHNIEAHKLWISALSFLDDGVSLVTAGMDGFIAVWDIRSGLCLKSWSAHDRPIRDIVVDSDRSFIFAVSEDGALSKWDLRGSLDARVPVSGRRLKCAALSPDRSLLAVSGDDGKVRIVTSTDLSTREIGQVRTWVRCMVFLGSDSLIGGCDDGKIYIWRIGPNDPGAPALLADHGSRVWSVRIDKAHNLLASAGSDGIVKLWNADSWKLSRSLVGHSSWVRDLAFGAGAPNILVSASEDQSIRVWDTDRGSLVDSIAGYALRAFDVVTTSDAVISGHGNHSIYTWLTDSEIGTAHAGHKEQVFKLAGNTDSSALISGSDDGEIRLWRVMGGRLQPTAARRVHDGWVGALAFSPDGRYIISGADDQQLVVSGGQNLIELASAREHSGRISGVTFVDLHRFVTCSEDGSLIVWNLDNGTVRAERRFQLPGGPLYAIDCWPSENQVAVGASDGVLRRVDVRTGLIRAYRLNQPGPIWGVACGEDDEIFTAGDDSTVRRYFSDLEKEPIVGHGHTRQVWSVRLDHVRQQLVSAGEDGTVRMWSKTDVMQIGMRSTPRRYEGLNVTGASGLSPGQIETLASLGATT